MPNRLLAAAMAVSILGACGGDRSTASGDAGVSTTALTARDARRALWGEGVAQPAAAVRLVPGVITKVPGTGSRFVLRRADAVVHFDERGLALSLSDGKRGWGVHATLRAGTRVQPIGARRGQGKVDRYVGEPSQWARAVPTYEQLAWEEAAPGIDWLVEPSRGGFSYQYVLSPGADLHDLDTEWSGANELRAVDDGRGVAVVTGVGTVRVSGLRAFAIENGRRVELPARHVVSGNVVRIVVEGWSGKVPLVIDPSVAFSTFLGGAASEYASATAIDASGNVYVTGSVGGAGFPTTSGLDTTYGGGFGDVFVTKFSPTGALVWSTYLGGAKEDSTRDIAVDAAGNVLVVGTTNSTDFPTSGGFDAALTGGFDDGFVTKLDAAGALVWSSYLGGVSNESAQGVAIDGTGNAFVVGYTGSSDFPTVGGFDTTLSTVGGDGFVTKVSAAGALVWSSYLGGASTDSAHDVATDAAGNAVVVGTTRSTDFPTTSGLDTTLGGFENAFVTKISGAGAIVWSTYLGGSGSESFPSVAVSAAGDVHVAGSTTSNDFPTTGGFDTTRSFLDAFVTKLNSSGTLIWSSFLGGTGFEDCNGIAVDGSGAVFVVGNTDSINFPTVGGFDASTAFGEGFVTKISATGALVWSSYLGGSNSDGANDVAALGDAVVVVGYTNSSDFPRLSAFDSTVEDSDAFIFHKTQSTDGAACTHLSDCASAFCVDGVCCNEACAGTCRACSAAKKGTGANGVCGSIANGSDPDTECAVAVCGMPGFVEKARVCDGSGACRSDGTTSCGLFACASGACLTTCTSDANCAPGNYCATGVCTVKKTPGASCTAAVECATGFCADGFCCDRACGGDCEACSAAMKGSGADGTCGNVAADSNPKMKCTPDVGFPTSCRGDGLCDGAGACRVYAKPGTACGTTTCTGAAVTGPSCNGAGTCDSTPRSCGAYACDAAGVACRTSCATDAECTGTSYCTSLGTCAPRKTSGSCAAANECMSGFCVDGVCCSAACTGQCEACNVAGTEGTCSAVTGAPRGSRAACAGDPAVCGGTCDGTNRASCVYEPSTKSCGSVCAGGQQTPSTCDAKGACAAGTSVSCAPYTCDAEGKACRAACTANADCTNGYECVSSACVPARTTGTCSLDGKTSTSVDGMVTACGAYRCDPSTGACRQLCGASADCAEGNICDVASKVCSTPAASEEDGGCGCSTPGGTGSRPLALLALLMLAAVRRRRD